MSGRQSAAKKTAVIVSVQCSKVAEVLDSMRFTLIDNIGKGYFMTGSRIGHCHFHNFKHC